VAAAAAHCGAIGGTAKRRTKYISPGPQVFSGAPSKVKNLKVMNPLLNGFIKRR
jgi:hypothetical protein